MDMNIWEREICRAERAGCRAECCGGCWRGEEIGSSGRSGTGCGGNSGRHSGGSDKIVGKECK